MSRSVSRYDLLLAIIGAPLVAASAVGALTSLAMWMALAAGSVSASGGIGYAVFLAPPTESR